MRYLAAILFMSSALAVQDPSLGWSGLGVADSSVALHWSAVGGDGRDWSGHGFNTTFSNDYAIVNNLFHGWGTNGFAYMPWSPVSQTEAKSVFCWIKINAFITGVSPRMVSSSSAGSSNWVLAAFNNSTPGSNLWMCTADNNVTRYGLYYGASNVTGVFYHVGFTYNGSITWLWVNGQQLSNTNDPGALGLTGSGTYVAARSATVNVLAGDLDNIIVYKKALSSNEVRQLYVNTKARH